MKILYVGNLILSHPKTGGEYINYRNYQMLISVFGEKNVHKIEIPFLKSITKDEGLLVEKLQIGLNIFRGYLSGLTPDLEMQVCSEIDKNRYEYIFIGTAKMGRLAKKLKLNYPDLKILMFFHNVESLYFKDLVRLSGWYKQPLVWSVEKNEKLAISYADKRIVLNKRDGQLLENIYGVKVDLELPTSFKSTFIPVNMKNKKNELKDKIECLFVGSNFFANYEGVVWFINNVLPKINATLSIVGKGTEAWKEKFINNSKVKIIGTVDDLSVYYMNADCMILPIFSGSGMKTKTAEGLMYGKTIFGTTEAFEGYELEFDEIGGLCNTEEEFIEKINLWYKLPRAKYNAMSRKIFEERYNIDKSIEIFQDVL